MYKLAFKMLVEDKAKYIGMLLSLSLSAMIITQQAGIFVGLMRRTYSSITDTNQPEIWVMDPSVRLIDESSPMKYNELFRVKSVHGVAWAVPFFRGLIRSCLSDGTFQMCTIIGIDDASLIGGPPSMLEGTLTDLRKPDSVIIDAVGARDKLARTVEGRKVPVRVGDTLEINDRRAYVVGICNVTRTFRSQPVIYTTYTNAVTYVPLERKQLTFILAKSDGTISSERLAQKIARKTGLKALTKRQFEELTVSYYLVNTGIPINFGLAVLLGLLVGAAIAGQIFYNFTTDSLKYLALFCVMGASRRLLAKMTMMQALWLALLGWLLGSGCAALLVLLTANTELSFFYPWELFFGTGFLMATICVGASLISIRRIYTIELASVFKV